MGQTVCLWGEFARVCALCTGIYIRVHADLNRIDELEMSEVGVHRGSTMTIMAYNAFYTAHTLCVPAVIGTVSSRRF